MKICDLTQFYSPASGGVKRYIAEKLRFMRHASAGDEHILVVPGERDAVLEADRSRTYTIESPLVSRTSQYRILLRLEAVERILESERPDIIECGDPYQAGWRAIAAGANLGIPVVGFYHSHFPEAYLRGAEKFLGAAVTDLILRGAKSYVGNLYNRFARTIVPSPALADVLQDWGVRNVVHCDLGVDASVFHPDPEDGLAVRQRLGIAPNPSGKVLLLYVGRLAQEKNTHTLFEAYLQLARAEPGRFHLMVVGDGLQRRELEVMRSELRVGSEKGGTAECVTWVPYCTDARELAGYYRAADIFVHPGVQETFGLVSLEAQACGTPVLGIRGSYMDRIIHNPQTWWAAENCPGLMANAIRAQATDLGSVDPAELHRTIASRYAWAEVFQRLFAVYAELV